MMKKFPNEIIDSIAKYIQPIYHWETFYHEGN